MRNHLILFIEKWTTLSKEKKSEEKSVEGDKNWKVCFVLAIDLALMVTAQSLNLKHMSCAFSVANSHFLALSWLQSAFNMAWFRVSPDSLLSRLSIAPFWLGLVTLRLFRLILSLCHSQVVFAMVRGFSSTLAAFLLTVQLSSVSVFSGGDLSPRTDTFCLLGLARYCTVICFS